MSSIAERIGIHHVLLAALGLRWLYLPGFALGDDPAYADLATRMLEGMAPPLCDVCVFSFRYIFLGVIALSLKLLGHSDIGLVLPILLSSLACVYLVYELGALLFDRSTGILAATLLSVFPLELVHAGTLTNDILLSMFFALCMLLCLKGFEKGPPDSTLLFPFAGAVLGLAIGVKINSLPVILLFVWLFIHKERKGRNGLALFLVAWLLVQAGFCLWYYVKTGDCLAHIHAELKFNNRYNPSEYRDAASNLADTLLFYPKMMLCLATEGHVGDTFYPYGLFYPAFLAALLYFPAKRDARVVIPLVWFFFLFGMMELTPLRVVPYYQPIHRLIRFLSIVTVPSLLVVAFFLSRLALGKPWLRVLSLCLLGGLIVTSLHQSYRKSRFYIDCMRDSRTAFALVSNMDYTEIATDQEMKNALLFYGGYRNREKVKSFENDHPYFPDHSLVILGGSRRPDMSLDYAADFAGAILPEAHWVKICEVRGRPEIWRPTNLVIYRVLERKEPGAAEENP